MNVNSIKPPRGMNDVLPTEMKLRSTVISKILNAYQNAGFLPIETPALESLSFLARETAGENKKLIFNILKRGEDLEKALANQDYESLADLGLRFDLTVPLARYFSANRGQLPSLFKAIQIGPVWRAERPQKGRLRQFYQCDIDILGDTSPLCELELLGVSADALHALGLNHFIIRVNDRRILAALASACGFPKDLHHQVFIALDKIDKIGVNGVEKELYAYFPKQEAISLLMHKIQAINAPRGKSIDLEVFKNELNAHIDMQIISNLAQIIQQVDASANGRFRCIFDPALVRGLGYYTGTIFEFSYKDYPFSIAGGGRYDEMVKEFSKIDTPACGLSIGLDRLMLVLHEEKLLEPIICPAIVLIYDKKLDMNCIMNHVKQLKQSGQPVTLFPKQKNFSKLLDELSTYGIASYQLLDANGHLSPIKALKGSINSRN